MKTALYRHYDADGTLLYVGITNAPFSRWSQHTSRSEWVESVTRVDIEWFATRPEAETAERDAIAEERPVHNVYLRKRTRTSTHVYRRKSNRGHAIALFELGSTPRQIARALAISPQGVYGHLKSVGYEAPYVTPDYQTRVRTLAK